MNRLEELLIILAEECAEIQQAAIKCVRFGMDSVYMEKSNRNNLESEIGDLMAMVKLIMEETNLSEENVMNAAEKKLVKVERFMRNGKTATPIVPLTTPNTNKKPRKNRQNS